MTPDELVVILEQHARYLNKLRGSARAKHQGQGHRPLEHLLGQEALARIWRETDSRAKSPQCPSNAILRAWLTIEVAAKVHEVPEMPVLRLGVMEVTQVGRDQPPGLARADRPALMATTLEDPAVVLVATDIPGANDVLEFESGYGNARDLGPDVLAEGAAGTEALANRDVGDLRGDDALDVEVVIAGVGQRGRNRQLGRAPFRHPARLSNASRTK